MPTARWASRRRRSQSCTRGRRDGTTTPALSGPWRGFPGWGVDQGRLGRHSGCAVPYAESCGERRPKRSTVARAVASRHGASDNARRPKPKPTRKPGPGSRHSATPSTWRSSRHSGATSGAWGSAGQLPGGPGLGSEPSHAIPHPPHQDGGQELWRPAAANRLGKPGLVVDSKEVMTSRPLLASSMEASTGVFRGLRLLGPPGVGPCVPRTTG